MGDAVGLSTGRSGRGGVDSVITGRFEEGSVICARSLFTQNAFAINEPPQKEVKMETNDCWFLNIEVDLLGNAFSELHEARGGERTTQELPRYTCDDGLPT